MFLQSLDLTPALRPSLLPDELLVCIQDAVGLYEGNEKIPGFQRGHAYLTSLRLCYVDNEKPRANSIAVSLRDVDRYEFYGGFLKSSPKLTLYPKPYLSLGNQSRSVSGLPSNQASLPPISRSSNGSPVPRKESPFRVQPAPPPPAASHGTWICSICSFSNPVPSNFDPRSVSVNREVPPCLACGIKPDVAHVLKAAIAAASGRSALSIGPVAEQQNRQASGLEDLSINDIGGVFSSTGPSSTGNSSISCPRCTFSNHYSLLSCEMCGAPLADSMSRPQTIYDESTNLPDRTDSPGPLRSGLSLNDADVAAGIKIAFRAGGEKKFYEHFKGAMIQRRWILQSAPPIPEPTYPIQTVNRDPLLPKSDLQPVPSEPKRSVGIAGLERRGLDRRKNNELVIGNAFEDLEALMASAKEIMALAETFSIEARSTTNGESSDADALLSESATALGVVVTKDMMGSGNASENLYLSELARTLAEYLTDDSKGVLRQEGGIISLVDLWAVFNRSRGGVELVSPSDFEKAARLWEKLKLPVRLRQFKSGLLVVQSHDWSDEKTIRQLLNWFHELHSAPPEGTANWDWVQFGRGVTVQEAAHKFRWSVGVASEELEMAEDKGILCREEGAEGLRFWENHFLVDKKDVPHGF
ncbi:MAG: hypothetical protein M1834_003874 [Cirrosporium novae-zelandiae]|nr:MAG: hypothetical protein M1834_003874 [Cirrosporium novae-zelandiae]